MITYWFFLTLIFFFFLLLLFVPFLPGLLTAESRLQSKGSSGLKLGDCPAMVLSPQNRCSEALGVVRAALELPWQVAKKT
ncbi:hypothetical protein L228DRAFT_123747 [Xylona heveae TC161]|uniref:Uncharacterized protein n=1 Tax=Xylona heveae (strain CBS 132557 / TC161) TaxID=1328760 RepID=A0A165HNF2_XYLHT|nr:hypothetical protein L228DRAFT_123747 [Xylona heveae TC161]KZF23772.1 hypothetical protein L228DRAFT_123747 [Xylona heveae TC161]